jgi:hypothetical protein
MMNFATDYYQMAFPYNKVDFIPISRVFIVFILIKKLLIIVKKIMVQVVICVICGNKYHKRNVF